ncbi:chaperone modulator CbpM [Pseudonocardia phyllosphaerae]|uniref:chaperone modulator CbpM n=1 Tax=Pseudonocardia phyllosphaerae TaxID=3390502 RepID=UPI00397D12D4
MTYPIVLGHLGAHRLDLETFARVAGVHPELLRRLAVLGLVDYVTDSAGNPWFPMAELPAVGRLRRLRAGLDLNYAALGVVVELLDRISELEAELARRPRTGG